MVINIVLKYYLIHVKICAITVELISEAMYSIPSEIAGANVQSLLLRVLVTENIVDVTYLYYYIIFNEEEAYVVPEIISVLNIPIVFILLFFQPYFHYLHILYNNC